MHSQAVPADQPDDPTFFWDRGPWTVDPDGRHLYSGGDEGVCLRIDGDFESPAARQVYARELADRLNGRNNSASASPTSTSSSCAWCGA